MDAIGATTPPGTAARPYHAPPARRSRTAPAPLPPLYRRHQRQFVACGDWRVEPVARHLLIVEEHDQDGIERVVLLPDERGQRWVATGERPEHGVDRLAVELNRADAVDPVGEQRRETDADGHSARISGSKTSCTRAFNWSKNSRVTNAGVVSAGFGWSNTSLGNVYSSSV